MDSIEAARTCFHGHPAEIEVIVADNGSTDATGELARSRGCRVISVSKRCIAAARNGGAAAAQGKIIAFCDADFRIHPNTFNYIKTIMAQRNIVGGATGLTMERWSLGIFITWYLILPPLIAMGLDGGIWFCRRTDFVTIGGFDERVRIGEDARFLLALKQLGKRNRPRQWMATRYTAKRFGLRPPLVINSSRKFDKYGDWHMLTDIPFQVFRALFARKKLETHIEHYWYEDRS